VGNISSSPKGRKTDCSLRIQTYRGRELSLDWLVLSHLLPLHQGSLHIGDWMGKVLKKGGGKAVWDEGESGR
jgi:hypothetical protein